MSLNFLLRNPRFNELVQSLEHGRRDLTVTGLTAAAKPLFLACLGRKLNRRIVYIQSSALPLAAIDEESRFYLSQFSSPLLTETLPELAENPYLEIPPSLDAISTRMRFFYNLMHSDPALVFTNLFGLLKPFPGSSDMEDFYLGLGKGDTLERERLLGLLAEFGYSREDLIASHGEYAWRGGIVDVFSPWQANPFRIELSGSRVASLREFDASTQRSLKMLDRILVPSLREFPGSKDFVHSWTQAARKRASGDGRDLQEKIRSLQGGDYFPSFVFLSLLERSRFVPFSRYLEDSLFIIDEPDEVEKDWIEEMKNLEGEYEDLRRAKSFCIPPDEIYSPELWSAVREKAVRFQELGTAGSTQEFSFGFQSVPKFDNKIPFFLQYLKRLQRERELCYIYLSHQGTRQRLAALLLENGILVREASSPMETPERGEALLLLGGLERGFSCPSEKITFFSEKDIFTEEKVLVSRAPRKVFASQFQDLRSGDLVVHADYGIGLFNGLQKVAVEGTNREFIELLYRDSDKLLVPVEDLNLVQKFSKSGTDLPQLDKLGTNTWEKTKARTKKAVEAIAKELLDLYAERKAVEGFTFSPEGEWDADFDRIFEYEATEDQVRSIKEIMRDMESQTPMDRLLCGDVGYGKTEVAMRAAFKAVMDGKQVAVLCPTTVLASQHLKTFRNRMVLFPVRIEGLTRLQTKGEQKKLIDDLKSGQIDIIIGTHRLLSKDIGFRDLGLLIVDEEQRFGVNHKEKIKQMRANVDVLTLTATPIPRTLNLSLTGLRDISLIETPPRDRLSVHSVVTPFNTKLIASAIRQELNRGGQVYYL
ncbi:MAG: CarD family transcriptional regulator, partial [Acidobacteriota bacterium]|nr:CarD family transcriptional regulator [Acidobacteriota bacterium]